MNRRHFFAAIAATVSAPAAEGNGVALTCAAHPDAAESVSDDMEIAEETLEILDA